MKLGERIKPVRVPTRNVGEIQLPSAMTRMSQVGIPLFEPSDDQMRRWLDKVKESIAVPEPLIPPLKGFQEHRPPESVKV